MRLRIGLVVGFGTGYYLGSKAGRERYEQLRRLIDRIGPVGKLHAAVELGTERIREAVTEQPAPNAGDAVVPPSPN